MFKHFILTRFNIKLDGISSVDKNNQPIQTEKWLENRFYLFKKYCFPSIQNQTSKNFIWFVLFDTKTPQQFIQKIKNFELQFSLFKPLFMNSGDYETIKRAFNQEMTQYLEPNDQYIITSRIDNDDLYHKQMIYKVQKQFAQQHDVFLSAPYGLQYDINRYILARMYYENNHFISRIERISSEIQTVITHDHSTTNKIGKMIYINRKSEPLWLEIVHSSNVKNSLRNSSIPIFINKKTNSFQLEIKISLRNTIPALFKYLKLQVFLARAAFLKMIGIYDFLKKFFHKQ